MISLYTRLQGLLSAARTDESGQTMAEYAVILAVIIVAVSVSLVFLGDGINSTISSLTSSL